MTCVLHSTLIMGCAGNADSSVVGCKGKNVQLNCSLPWTGGMALSKLFGKNTSLNKNPKFSLQISWHRMIPSFLKSASNNYLHLRDFSEYPEKLWDK